MKKILVAGVCILVLTMAGSAMAEGWGHSRGMKGGGMQQGMGMRGGRGSMQGANMCGGGRMQGGYGGCSGWHMSAMPQDIRDKMVEAEKTAVDLRAAMSATPMDRTKVMELHAKYRSLRQAVSDWRFEQRLDTLQQPASGK